MRKVQKFILPENSNLIETLHQSFSVIQDEACTATQTFYDTFDWRLYSKGLLCIRDNNVLQLVSLTDEKVLRQTTITSRNPVEFWWDIKESAFQQKLKDSIDVRALLPVALINIKTEKYHVLNKNDTPAFYFHIEQIAVVSADKTLPLPKSLKILPPRENTKIAKTFIQYLSKNNAPADSHYKNILTDILHAINKQPLDYSSKIRTQLTPAMPAQQAVKCILTDLFTVMKRNVDGIIADIDSEFLHDFRVAGRRTRAALSQLNTVFPQEKVRIFKQLFSGLGKLTNNIRDFDVFLLHKVYYRTMLPPHLQKGLSPFFTDLARTRKTELKKLVEWCNSDLEKIIFKPWHLFLNLESEYDETTIHANTPVINLAKESIMNRYKKIIKNGSKITDSTPDAKLHNLRIECKKLRYLMEFFCSLFPATDAMFLIKQLKKLQDIWEYLTICQYNKRCWNAILMSLIQIGKLR